MSVADPRVAGSEAIDEVEEAYRCCPRCGSDRYTQRPAPLTVPHKAADLLTRLAPVLSVRDLAAERAFCEKLGLPVIYRGPGVPGVQALKGPNEPREAHVLASRRALAALRLRHSARERCR